MVNARLFAARSRVLIAASGLALIIGWPDFVANPLTAAIGFLVIGLTGVVHSLGLNDRWLRTEEGLACSAGFLIVTLGGSTVSALWLLWLASAAIGVLARGGRVGGMGRILIVGVLISPLALHGPNPDTLGLLIAGMALLMSTGRVSLETAELLRDPLTGALTRGAFEAEAARRLTHSAEGEPIALVMIDLDDFGLINKTEGHRAGDSRLAAAAAIMSSSIRDEDIFGRVGGDEFAILTASDSPMAVADRLVAELSAGGSPGSAGVARMPDDGEEPATLLSSADDALRSAKRDGKDRALRAKEPTYT